jgi:hypothetical protein
MSETDLIAQAADLIRSGRREEARPILARHLQSHRDSVDGWMLMSMCISDRARQVDCLNQVLRLQPNHSLARSRLAKLTSATGPVSTWPVVEAPPPTPARPPSPPKVPPFAAPSEGSQRPFDVPLQEAEAKPEASPPAPPRRGDGLGPIVFIGAVVAGMCGIAAVIAYVFAANRQAQQQQAFNAAATVAAYTLPPTWTATVTPTITQTPTPKPTATVTPTPTPPIPNPTILAEMDLVQQEVSDIRGLEPLSSGIPRFLLSKFRVRPVLEASFEANGGSREALTDEARVLSALGLIKPTYDLYTNALNGLTDSLGGFYFPWNDELYVIGTRFSGIERFIFSHEYAHALTDQHFDIGNLGVYPLCLGDAQRCQAIRALVEGDATLVMNQWWEQYANPQDYIDILNYRPPAQTLPEQFPPPYVLRDSQFPYVEGLAFVEALYARGRWARVNQAFSDPPESTEQILHPSKYFAGEAPVPMAETSMDNVLGPDWRLLESNSLGEWMTYLLLAYGADVDAQVDDAAARTAANGWGGDRYQVYYNDTTDQIILAARWAWDTQADANGFINAMKDYLGERFGGNELPSARGDCWEANAQRTCLYTSGRVVLWLLAPDASMIEAVLARFPTFR